MQVAGLDVGWHTLLDLKEDPETHRLEVTREVLPGTYPFKFIVDGRWVANYDYPTYQVRCVVRGRSVRAACVDGYVWSRVEPSCMVAFACSAVPGAWSRMESRAQI